MRCRKCGKKAAIHLRQHRLALCGEHFPEWLLEQTERFIKKYQMFTHHDRILVAVSGGKDSLSLWDVLWKLGYSAEGLYIHLGIGDEYSDESQRCAESFAAERGLALQVVNVQQVYGETVPQIALRTRRGEQKACSVCGVVKRHIMNQAAFQQEGVVLVTGHNLDDEASVLWGNTLQWQTDLMRRQFPVLVEKNGFARKAKPFCRFYERETAAYALLNNIQYMEEECSYATGNVMLETKAVLNRLEDEKPGLKLRFYVNFLHARQEGLLFPVPPAGETEELHLCPTCGQPTALEERCSFCRLF